MKDVRSGHVPRSDPWQRPLWTAERPADLLTGGAPRDILRTDMLADARIGANVPVSDLDQAVAFYEGRLGLTLLERDDEHHYARFTGAGDTKLAVYQSGTAGQARHTLASFVVDDVHAVVAGLKANGVVLEEYDLPGMKTEEGVAEVGDTRAAWLKDPDGNILEIVGA